MDQSGKLAIVILVILLILSLAGVVIGFYSFQQEKLKVSVLNKELENLKVERRIIENKLAESRRRNSDLEVQLWTVNTQVEELNSELEQTKDEQGQLNSQIGKLQSRLQEEAEIRKELEAQKMQAQEQVNKLQAMLKASKDELKTQLNKFKTSQEVALGKIVVGQSKAAGEVVPQPQTSAIPQGEVLVINKDYDFAVVSLGSQDGIGIGDALSVYHNGSYIGDIRIERAQQAMSACAFESDEIEDIIKEGDKVIKK